MFDFDDDEALFRHFGVDFVIIRYNLFSCLVDISFPGVSASTGASDLAGLFGFASIRRRPELDADDNLFAVAGSNLDTTSLEVFLVNVLLCAAAVFVIALLHMVSCRLASGPHSKFTPQTC